MKKTIFTIALALAAFAPLAAQESGDVLVGKKGTPILPVAGDIAIGVEATPYLNYLGNMFNNTSNNSLSLGSNTLYSRYFIADDAAIRIALKIKNTTDINRYYVRDDARIMQDPLSNAQAEDVYTNKNREYTLAIGYQKFRGYGRLRGFYGAQVFAGLAKNSYEYSYGNPITALNTAPTTHWSTGTERTLNGDNGLSTTLGIGGLAGVEYYFAPKICIGGELNLNYSYSKTGQGDSTTEKWIGTNVVEQTTPSSPGDTKTSLSTSRPGTFVSGQIYLMFHF
jgi:hypothetical protein